MSYKFSVSPRDAGKYHAALGRSFYKTIRDAMNGAAENTMGHLIEATLLLNPASPNGSGDTKMGAPGAVNTGRMVDSFKIVNQAGPGGPAVKKAAGSGNGARPITVTIVNTSPYYKYVTEGRKPGTGKIPPQKPIEQWLVNRHGWDAHDAKWGARRLAVKIQKYGFAPRPIAPKARSGIVKMLQTLITFALRTWLKPSKRGP